MRIALLFSFFLVWPGLLQADDSIDVRGGIFGDKELNRDMFSNRGATLEDRKPAAKKEAPEKVKPKPTEDTFAVESKEEFLKSVKPAAEDLPKMPKAGTNIDRDQIVRDSVAVKAAAESIERLKAMTASGVTESPVLKSSEFYRNAVQGKTSSQIPKAVDSSKGRTKVNQAVEPKQNPKALGRQMIAEERASKEKARVSLIVRAQPVEHFDKQLAMLQKLHDELGIEVERLIVADFDKVYLDYASRPVAEFIPKKRSGRVQYPRTKRDLTELIADGNLADLYQLAEVEYRPQFLNSWGSMSTAKKQKILSDKDDRQMEKLARSAITRRSKQYGDLMTSMSDGDIKEIEDALEKGYAGKPEKIANVPESFRRMNELDLRSSKVEEMVPLLKQLGVTRSPAWVFHVGSEIHVFEGEYDPTTLLTTDGRLMVPKGR